MIYDLIYALAAKDGRERVLFGPHRSRGSEAFSRSAPGENFPELWFELPLQGEPWFDIHVMTSRKDLDPQNPVDPNTCSGYDKVFNWFAAQESAKGLVISWDLNGKNGPSSGLQFLLRRKDIKTACGFLEKAGCETFSSAYCSFLERMPSDWFACYLGVFPSRSDQELRIECTFNNDIQEAYAKDPSLIRQHLSQVGLNYLDDSLITSIHELAATPFRMEYQFNVKKDGSLGDTFAVSLRFAVNPEKDWSFHVNGAAGDLMKRLESLGLADERWREIEGTAFAMKLKHGQASVLLYCAPIFVKIRFHKGIPLDAKTYLVSGTY